MEQRTMSLTATIALSILTLIVGFMAGMMATNPDDPSAVLSQMTETTEGSGESTDEPSGSSSPEETADSGNAVAFTLRIDSLSDSQKNMLKTMGIEGDEIAITHDMLACAEAGIGSGRLEEIKNGAIPSTVEGAQLLACYN